MDYTNNVQPLNRPYCQVVLPLVYDDALSYYEVLEKLRVKINELLTYADGILPEAMKYTDASLVGLEGRLSKKIDDEFKVIKKEFADISKQIDDKFDTFDAEAKAKFKEQDKKLADLQQKILEDIDVIQNDINRMYTLWSDYQLIVDAKFTSMYADLERYVDEKIGTLTQLYVINPITGKLEDINQVLREMFNAFNVYGLTAIEYDNLHLKAQEYDQLELTAREYDFKARLRLFSRLYVSMYNPFTGLWDKISNVVYKLVDLHRAAYTALEYDNLNYKADEYDNFVLTAYDYDFNAKNVI